MKITVVGAGAVGASCAEYIAIKNFASEVVLVDIKENYAGNKSDINTLLNRIERLLPTEEIQRQENDGILNSEPYTFDEILEFAKLDLKRK